jgi:hypothetical protein
MAIKRETRHSYCETIDGARGEVERAALDAGQRPWSMIPRIADVALREMILTLLCGGKCQRVQEVERALCLGSAVSLLMMCECCLEMVVFMYEVRSAVS